MGEVDDYPPIDRIQTGGALLDLSSAFPVTQPLTYHCLQVEELTFARKICVVKDHIQFGHLKIPLK